MTWLVVLSALCWLAVCVLVLRHERRWFKSQAAARRERRQLRDMIRQRTGRG